MTADPADRPSRGRLERSPDAIRAALPPERRATFDAAYTAALEEARATYRLDGIHDVIETWWRVVVVIRDPNHATVMEDGGRLLAGEEIETYPVDLEALRRG